MKRKKRKRHYIKKRRPTPFTPTEEAFFTLLRNQALSLEDLKEKTGKSERIIRVYLSRIANKLHSIQDEFPDLQGLVLYNIGTKGNAKYVIEKEGR